MLFSPASNRSVMDSSAVANRRSEDGREIIEVFLFRLIHLLTTAHNSQISHDDSQKAITYLSEITSTFSPSQIDISLFSEPLSILAGTSYEGNISLQVQASCLLVLHKHLSMLSSSPKVTLPKQSHMIFFLSLQADQSLQEVDSTRRMLEHELLGYLPSGAHIERILQSLITYLHAIDSSSQAIVALWKNSYAKYEATKDVVGDWLCYLAQFQKIVRSNSPLLKGEDLLSVSFQNIPLLPGKPWSLLALTVMGYMRHTNVYPLLPEFFHRDFSSRSNPVEFWFPFLKDADERWISETFARELRPLVSALNLFLQHGGLAVQVQDHSWSSSYDMMDILHYSLVRSLPQMPTKGFPFSLLASIIYATFNECEMRALFDLVSVLQRSNFGRCSAEEVRIVAGPIIAETLCIFQQFFLNHIKGPLLFSFGVLQKLLNWEREGSTFPFSDKNMEYIVRNLFRKILQEQNLLVPLVSDCVDNTRSMEYEDGHSVSGRAVNPASTDSPIIFYDLQDLNIALAQPDTLAEKLTDILSVAYTTQKSKIWEEGNYRRVKAEEKDDICLRIMEGRKMSRYMVGMFKLY